MTLVFQFILKSYCVWKLFLAQAVVQHLVLDSAELFPGNLSAKIRTCHAYKVTKQFLNLQKKTLDRALQTTTS